MYITAKFHGRRLDRKCKSKVIRPIVSHTVAHQLISNRCI